MIRWLALSGILAYAAAVPLPTDETGADWPTFRGAKRDGISPDTGLLKEWPKDGPPQFWNEPAKGIGEGLSSVCVAGGKIFTMGDVNGDCFVFCLSRATGKKLWGAKIAKAANPGGYSGPGCTPTVDGDLLYALHRDGELVCLGVAEGNIVWQRNLRKDFGGRPGGYGYSESPLVDGDKLLVSPGGKEASIVALNRESGDLIWRAVVVPAAFPGDRAEHCSMVISESCGVRQYIQMLHENVVGVNAKDGKLLWNYKKLGTTANVPTPIVVKGDHVLACAGYGKSVALIKLTPNSDGTIKAEELYYKNKGTKHGGMIMVGDYVYLDEDSSGKPYCAKVMTGDIVWARQRSKTGCPGGGSASITYADGNLYIRYESGHMALVKATADGYKEKGWFKIPGDKAPSWTHPVVIGGMLYIRSQDQLLCYDVRAK